MADTARERLLIALLENAAERLGDITPRVMERFYARFPEAENLFQELYPSNRHKLEGEMVEQILYCLMEWFNAPTEIEIILTATIPHHVETLKVPPRLFRELIDTVFATIGDTISADRTEQRQLLDALHEDLIALCDAGMEGLADPR